MIDPAELYLALQAVARKAADLRRGRIPPSAAITYYPAAIETGLTAGDLYKLADFYRALKVRVGRKNA